MINFYPHQQKISIKGNFKLVALAFYTLIMLGFQSESSFAQLAGTRSIPSANYPTIKVAVDSLNLYGVAGGGGITFDVAGGYTELLTARLNLTATGTLADQIVFQKSGAGANPILTSYAGTALPATATTDGMWSLNGSDYVTINGIDLVEAGGNITPTTQMEYGYGLFKASAIDGANNNTIKNCVITLNRNNSTTGGAPFFHGSTGIALASCSPTTGTAVTAVTSISGASSNNRFYSNTIQNVNTGISMVGYAGATPFTLCDFNNDIGGASALTGNTIINFGGGTTPGNACAAVFHSNQWSANISYNLVNNNNGSGLNHAVTNRGIFLFSSSVGASATVNNNNITIQGGVSTTAIDWGIDCEMAQTGASVGQVININNNTMSMTKTAVSTAAFTAIWINSAATTVNATGNTITNFSYAGTGVSECILSQLAGIGTLNISNNTFNGVNLTGATGSHYNIAVTVTVVTALNINGNITNGVTITGATSKVIRGIYVSTAISTCAVAINNNSFQNFTWSGGTPTGEFEFIYGIGTALSYTINNNALVGSITIPTTGSTYLIYNSQSTPAITVQNNTITGTGVNRTGATGLLYGYYNFGVPTGTETISGNTWSNMTAAGTTTLYGAFFATNTTCVEIFQNNTISNLTAGTGALEGIHFGYGQTGSEISGNTVTNLTGAGLVTGIKILTTASNSLNVFNNNVNTLTTTGANAVIGIDHTAGLLTSIYKNKIYNINANNAAASAIGISVSVGTTVSVFNNIIGDLKTNTALTGANQIIGLSFTGGTTINAYYNTVYLNATTVGGANFGSSAISVNATPTTITLRNNIFVNNSTPTGSGLAVAYRRASTSLANHSTSSNNNLFYAGVPSASNLIFYDGTNSDQTIAGYKVRVASADLNSGTENPTFLSTVGSNVNFLHIDPTVATNVESGAANISGITDDYDAQTRQGNGGYIGTGTAPDIGADEFGGIAAAVLAAPITFGSNTATTSSFNITWEDNSVGEAGFIVYRSLNIGGPFTTIVGVITSTTSTGTGSTYSLSQTGLLGGTTYYYQVVANNFSSSAALSGNASTLPCGGGLSGTIPVGPTGTYSTLSNAIAALVTNGMTAPVILELQAAYTSGTETFPITIGNTIGCLNPTNTLTIRPETGVGSALAISSANAVATVDINGGNFVTFDGRPGGTGVTSMLNIINTNAAGVALRLTNDASNNTITYCDVQGQNTVSVPTISTAAGVIFINSANATTLFGNDNNTISNCNIHGTGPATANFPTIGIASFGTVTTVNSYNDNCVITNCNIYDYFNASLAATGIKLDAGNTGWSITNNSFYQTTAINVVASTATYRALWVTPNTGSISNAANGFVITGNFIGGTAPNGLGIYTMTGTANYIFMGMDLSVGLGTPTSVQNNTVSNLNLTGGFNTNSIYGINVANGNANVGTSTGNLIGSSTATGAITITTTVTNGSFIGLRSGAGGTINFSNNTVAGIDMFGNSTTIATGFNGIAGSGGASLIINNNTIGSSTLANSINMVSSSATSTTATAVRGIICNSGTAGVANSVTNNLIANINSNYSGTGSGNTMVGISVTTGTSTISGNTIRNLATATLATAGGGTAAALGMTYTSTATSTLISNNTIHTIKLTNPSNNAATQLAGIYFSGPASGTHTIEKNFIHSLSISSTTNSAGFITGMDLGVVSGVTITVKNNMIRLGLDENGASVTAPCTVRGITKNVPNSNIWFNSIYIGGTGVGTTATNTFALARSASATDNWRNNILVNNRSNTTTGGKHYAINLSTTANLTLNYNDYVATGTGGVFGFNGADVAGYSTNWVAGDANSYNNDPSFLNPTGTSSTVDLHIDPINATIIESTGSLIASVTDDFDGQTRASLTPTDMGADAGNFVNLLCNGQPVGGTASSTQSSICTGATAAVSVTGFTNVPGISLQWQVSATTGGPYVNVTGGSGATTASYTSGTLTADAYYVCLVSCINGGLTALSSEKLITVNDPQVISTLPGSRCGIGTVTLGATGSANTTLSWYTTSTGGSPIQNPSVNVPVTGFNNDIVANGVGTNSILGTTYAFGPDGAGYTFTDSTFKYVSTNALPSCFMPASKLAPSLLTSGLTYQFQDYGTSLIENKNAMSIANPSNGSYTSPLPSVENLKLVTPASYAKLTVLYESVVNTSPLTVDAFVKFTDSTTQSFPANSCLNWFTASSPAYSGMGRTTPAGVIQCGATPNMFEMNFNISTPNQLKQVAYINFSIPTVITASFPYNVNYFHAMALGGQAPSPVGSFTTPVISSNTTYYVQASSTGGSNQVSNNGLPTTLTSTQNSGLLFDLNVPVTLNSIQVYSTVAGTATISILNSALVNIYTSPALPIVASTISIPQTLNLGVAIPAGTGYRILVSNTGNSLGYHTGTFPIALGNGVGTITTGATATGTTTLNYFVYSMNTTAGCVSGRTAVVATVTSPPTLSLTSNQSVCNNNVAILTVTSNLPDYDSYVWTPLTNLYTDPAAISTPYTGGYATTLYARSTVGGNYTYTCSASNSVTPFCANTASTTVTIQQNATATITGVPNPVCSGTPTILTTTVASPVTAQVGNGTTTSTGAHMPYYRTFEGSHKQFLFTASELSSLGFTGGNFTKIEIPVTAVSAALNFDKFGIRMANTPATSLTAFQTPAFTFCYYTPSTTPVVGNNSYPFSTPFTWDGTSNVLLDIWFDNDSTSACSGCWGGTVTEPYTTTGFTSCVYYYADNLTTSSRQMQNITTVTGTSTLRPNFILTKGAINATAYSWSDGSTVVGTTNPLVVNPSTNTSYTVTATVFGCPIVSAPYLVNVNPLPSVPTASIPSTQCGFGTPVVSVISTTGASNPVFVWYDAPSGGNLLQTSTSTTYSGTISATTTFYVSEVGAGSCESFPRTVLVANVTSFDPISITAVSTTCVGTPILFTVVKSGSLNNYSYSWSANPVIGSGVVGTPTGSPQSFTATGSGNYIYTVTGVDGQCTAVAIKNISVYEGLNGTVSATQISSCTNSTGLITANVSGAGTVVNNDFTNPVLPGNMTSAGNDFAITGGQMRLTSSATGKNGGVLITNTTGLANNDFQIDFDMITTPGSGSPADGFSYSYGPDVVALPTGLGSTTVGATVAPNTTNAENGSGSALKLGFDAYTNGANTAGVYLMYNCPVWNQTPVSTGVIFSNSDVSWRATTLLGKNTHVTIKINTLGQVSMWLSGIQVVTNQQLPASYLTDNKTNWKHSFCARTGAEYEGHYIDNLVIQYNNFYEYSINGGGSWSTTNPIVAPGPGTYSVDARYVDVPACQINLGSVTINTPSYVSTASSSSVCSYTPAMPLLGFLPTFAGGATYIWESSPAGANTWVPVSGGTNATLTPASILANTDFRCNIYCAGIPITGSPSTPVTINYVTPVVSSPVPGTHCGPGNVPLSASASFGSTLNWYQNASGGSVLGSGLSFLTPFILSNTTFYVSASTGGGTNQVSNNGLPTVSTTTTNAGLQLDVTQALTLNSVNVYPTIAGTITLVLQNSSGVVITGPQNFTVSAGTLSTPQTLSLGWSIPAGTGYRLLVTAQPGGLGYHGGTFPVALGNGVGNVTSGWVGTATSTLNYFIYSLNTSTGCESTRIPVLASITAAPTVSVSTNATICNGQSASLSASSSNPDYTYTWLPAGGTGSTVSVSPNSTTTYTVTGTDLTGGPFGTCSNFNTVTVTVNPLPPPVTVTPPVTYLCGGGSQQLVASAPSLSSFIITGTSPTTSSGVPQPFYRTFEGFRQQYIIRASELTAAGVTAGNITSISFNVSTLSTTYPQWNHNGYTIKIGATASSDLTAGWEPGLNVVYGPVTYSPTAGANVFPFSSGFTWNGTSNVVVEICFDNDIDNTCSTSTPICWGNNATCNIATAPFAGASRYYYSDNTTGIRDICSYTATGTVLSTRPVMTFGFAGSLTYGWSPGSGLNTTVGSTVIATPVASSTYTVTATNIFGCTSTTSASVNSVVNPIVYITPGDTTLCLGDFIFVHARDSGAYSGGWPAGTLFDWGIGPNPDDSIYLVNGPGIVQVTVTLPATIGACSDISDVATVIFRDSPILTLDSLSPNCFGTSTGKIYTTVSLGLPPFRYKYFNSMGTLIRDTVSHEPTDTLRNIQSGAYKVFVTDTVTTSYPPPSCHSDTAYMFVGEPELLEASQSNPGIDCNGNSTTVTVSAAGGTMAYTGTGTFTQSAGSQTYTVTDAHGCTSAVVVNLTEPDVLAVALTSSNIPCSYQKSNIGSNVTGGTVPYGYAWSNGASSASLANVTGPGTYTVMVTDAHGCTRTASITVAPPGSVTISGAVTALVCRGIATGAIATTIGGGIQPYSYLWNGGSTNQNRSGITAGTYTLTVTDANGCTKRSTFSVTQPATSMIINLTQTNVRCYGLSSGIAKVTPAGGTSPYSYSWNTFPVKTTAQITGLAAGVYTCTITDAIGCIKTAFINITEPVDLIVLQTQSNVTTLNGTDGSATVSVSGGTPGYTYSWNTTPVKTTATITGLTAGTYKCTITDTKSCTKKVTFVISQPSVRVNGNGMASESWNVKEYPNPTSGMVMLSFNNSERETFMVSLTDYTGRILYNKTSSAEAGFNEFMYDFSGYAKGVYFIKMESDNKLKTIRIVIQ